MRAPLHAAAIGIGTAAGLAAMAAGAQPSTPQPEGSAGGLCLWAMAASIEQVGKRCPGHADAAFQSALTQAVSRIDTFVMERSGVDRAGIAAFKNRHAGTTLSDEELCSADRIALYDAWRHQGADRLGAITDQVLAQPGQPQWGDCL